MKSGDESWTDIAKALRIDKDECRRRWEELAAVTVPEQGRNPAPSNPGIDRSEMRRRNRGARTATSTAQSDNKAWSPEFQYTQRNFF
jgi:hypothetical protein